MNCDVQKIIFSYLTVVKSDACLFIFDNSMKLFFKPYDISPSGYNSWGLLTWINFNLSRDK